MALLQSRGAMIRRERPRACEDPGQGPRADRPLPSLSRDVLRAWRLIERFTAGRSLVAYEADPMLSAAVARKFEVVGEALKLADAADDAIVERIPDLRVIVGLRNRIIHGYDAVDSETIWNLVNPCALAAGGA